MKPISLLNISILALLATPVAAFEWPSFNLDLSAVKDNNLNRAQKNTDISEDQFHDLRGSAVYFYELNPRHALITSGTLSTEKYDEYSDLDKLATGLGLTWQFMTRTGFDAPIYSLALKVEEADYKTDIRDDRSIRINMEISQHFTDRITTTLGLSSSKHQADSKVFDIHESRIFGNLDYTFNADITLYSTLSLISGDIVSTATPNLTILNWAEVLQPDNAFGGTRSNAIAYRLNATTRVLSLGLNYAINTHHSLDFSAMQIQSDADGSIEYDRMILRASYLTRF